MRNMTPRKKTTAINARVRPNLRLDLDFGRSIPFFFMASIPDQPMIRVAVASNLGGFSNVWAGSGAGNSHSRPSAPSQGR